MNSSGMSFGVSLPNRAVVFGVPAEEIIKVAEQADQRGFFDSVWVGDNLFSRPRMESIVLLSAIAARTSRVLLGTVSMASFPMRHPLLLSLQWASLDRLSEGRTILAVCLGDSARAGASFANELNAMGVRSAERVGRLEEGIEAIRATWAKGSASHHGRFYSFDEIEVLPGPQQERVPIVISSNPPRDDAEVEERSLRRVARLADGWQTYGHSPKLVKDRWSRIREYAEEFGRADDVTDCSMHLMINVGNDPEACSAEALRFFREYYGTEGEMHTSNLHASGGFGPPEQVAEVVKSYEGSGVTRLILRFASLDQRSQMQRFADQVAPLLGGAK